MAYTKQTWADGSGGATPLSAARLNALESGVAASASRADSTSYYRRGVMREAHSLDFADRPLISLRYDDNSVSCAVLADALAALGLVASFAVIAGSIDASGQMTTAQYQKAQLQGHQQKCHSMKHDTGPNTVPGANYPAGTSIEDQMFNEFIGAKALMNSKNLWGEEWVQPGTWVAGSGQNQSAYPPFLGGIATQAFYDQTDLGRLIQSQFFGVSTYTNDGWGVQTGYRPRPNLHPFGKSTNYYDNKTSDQAKAIVNAAIAGNNHLQMFCHPTPALMASDHISVFLPWLKAQVDAGRCYVVTESFGSLAKRGTPVNIIGDRAFLEAAASGVDAATLTTHISDQGNSYKSVTPPTLGPGDRVLTINGDGTVPALSINPGSNCNSDMEWAGDVPFRSLRCTVWAKGDGGASQLAPTVSLGGLAQSLTPMSTVALSASTWTKIEYTFGTSPSTTWMKPIWGVPSGAGNPALITAPVVTPT